MAEMIRFALVKDQWTPLLKGLSSRQIKTVMGNAGNKVAHVVKDNLVKASSQWESISGKIRVTRKGNASKVLGPQKGIYLDSMKPHYVPLKSGRTITQWAKRKTKVGEGGVRHFTKTVSGKSYIYSNKRGTIKGGAVFVTPHPWIQKPMEKSLRRSNMIIRRSINEYLKTLKQGG